MNVVSRWGLAALYSLMVASVGRAQGAPTTSTGPAQAAVEFRKASFEVQKYAYRPMDAFLKGAPFNAMAAETAAERIEMTSSMIPEVFRFDTRKFHVMTRALDGIWTNMTDFQEDALELFLRKIGLCELADQGHIANIRMPRTIVSKITELLSGRRLRIMRNP